MLMNVNGLIVAASENISLENTDGLLFTLYNAEMNIHFSILAHDIPIILWKGILVNCYYKFTDLKAGALETCSCGKIVLLKTTPTSNFSRINSLLSNTFEIADNLRSIISVPALNILSETDPAFKVNIISYRGFVTKIKDSKLGLYELDSKVLLYTTFNICSEFLMEGSEVFISNVHAINNCRENIILICCGLSSVRNINPNRMQEGLENSVSCSVNFCLEYALSIFDLFWLERLSLRLEMKFYSLLDEEDISLKKNFNILKKVLEYFIYFDGGTVRKKLSIVEEYFSFPHNCSPFSENRLPTDCDVPYLSEILDEARDDISWINAGQKWNFAISSQDNLVLIGILYLSNNGRFYIADQTSILPIIFTEDCNDCCHEQNILKEFQSSKNAHMIVIQEYDLIFECLSIKSGLQKTFQYIRTSCCRVNSLASLYKSKHKQFDSSPKLLFKKSEKYLKINEYMNNSVYHKLQGIQQYFLVLSKIWTVQNKIPYCSRVLVLLLPEKSKDIGNYSFENKSILEDTFNYYETDDDVEFATLLSKLNFLCIENQLRLGHLCFKQTDQCNVLIPGHIYIVNLRDGNVINENIVNCTSKGNNIGMFAWTIQPDTEIVHDSACLGKHCLEDYDAGEYCGVKEIFSSRQVKQNCIVSCILIDKTFEDVENADRKSGKQLNATLSMAVKDTFFEETINVYVPYFSESIFGLLPGSFLELHGFLCFCSQSGNLYLRASSLFGIQITSQQNILNSKYRYLGRKSNMVSKQLTIAGNYFHTSIKRLCFVLKIISAEVYSVCHECDKISVGSCSCATVRKIKMKVSVLIDDGSQQLLAYCSDKTARKLLNINESEWQSLASYVECSHQSLRFSDKMHYLKTTYLPIMNQVFNTYCSSKATCRQLLFEFIHIPTSYSAAVDVNSVWCKNFTDPVVRDVMLEFYRTLKQTD